MGPVKKRSATARDASKRSKPLRRYARKACADEIVENRARRTPCITNEGIYMKRNAIIIAALLAFSASAFAGTTFGVSGGFGSSSSTTGGSEAESGTNGTGYSTQSSFSQGYGIAAGGTGMGVGGFSTAGIGGSVSGSFEQSGSTSTSQGYQNGGGYGDSKSGVATNTSGYGYSNLAGSYNY